MLFCHQQLYCFKLQHSNLYCLKLKQRVQDLEAKTYLNIRWRIMSPWLQKLMHSCNQSSNTIGTPYHRVGIYGLHVCILGCSLKSMRDFTSLPFPLQVRHWQWNWNMWVHDASIVGNITLLSTNVLSQTRAFPLVLPQARLEPQHTHFWISKCPSSYLCVRRGTITLCLQAEKGQTQEWGV